MPNKLLNNDYEVLRLKALMSYQILDTPSEAEFDRLAELVAYICDTPYAFISMIDRNRQWHKARKGFEGNNANRDLTFCTHTIMDYKVMEVQDSLKDERFAENPYVVGDPKIRFYAGHPLESPNGYNIGTICVIDTKPKKLSEEQKKALETIAGQVIQLLELRKQNTIYKQEINTYIKNSGDIQHKDGLQHANPNFLYSAINQSIATIEFDPVGNIINANQHYLDMVGYTYEELVGQHHKLLLMGEDEKNYKGLWKMLQTGEYQSGIFKRRTKKGDELWIDGTYIPVYDSSNQVKSILKIARNISKEIEAENQMLKAKEIAENASIARENFLANMSHEIRTPMNAILGFTDLLLETPLNDSQKEYISSVKLAGKNLLSIINDILDLSKIESGKIHYEKNEFSIVQILKNIYDILYVKALEKNIKLEVLFESELPKVIIGDQFKLSQILINLVGNAIKFTSKGYVRLGVKLKSTNKNQVILQFRIEDTGIGIESDKLAMIFDRFTQANEMLTRAYGGTGLGLNISKLLVERMGGEISVKSKVGKGSEFKVHLPYELSSTLKLVRPKKEALMQSSDKELKILMCEDNPLNQKLAEVVIKQFGMEIDVAENGIEGLEMLKKKSYDLILMDLQMPKLDGYQTTEYIRRELKLTTPIIAITAHSLPGEKDKCINIGMNDYISKPFVKKELHEKIIKLTQ